MSVSPIASSNAPNQASSLPNMNQQQRTEFQQLTQALQSGNLSTAQQAFSALSQSAKVSGLQSLQLTQDLSKLGSALQSGNLGSARQAYSSVQQNLHSPDPMAAHHHRPHHGGSGSPFQTSGFPANTSNSGGSAAIQPDLFQPLNLTA